LNTSKLHRAMNEGKLAPFIEKLSDSEVRQLVDALKWEIINYKKSSKNYSKEKHEEYSVPYLEKREFLKSELEAKGW